MPQQLSEIECRIVGALIEKQLTTPEYYPLTLNALTAACNQKNNRDPVVSYDEKTVATALEELRDRNLIYVFYGSTSRVPKYKHMMPSYYELEPPDVAVMCVMMLRGPQTLGELKQRSERLHAFGSIGAVAETLDALGERGLARRLPRRPRQKEERYEQLLGGEEDLEPPDPPVLPTAAPSAELEGSRLAAVEDRLARLEREVAALREKLPGP